jgi:hypothetical protein
MRTSFCASLGARLRTASGRRLAFVAALPAATVLPQGKWDDDPPSPGGLSSAPRPPSRPGGLSIHAAKEVLVHGGESARTMSAAPEQDRLWATRRTTLFKKGGTTGDGVHVQTVRRGRAFVQINTTALCTSEK